MNLLSKGFLCVMATVVSLLVSNASLQAAPFNSGWQNDNTIALEGYGAAPSTSTSSGQLARRAAIVDAYRNLGEYVEGVRIDAETTVKDMVVRDDIIKTRVSAFIKGAKVISEKMNSDGSCTVVVSVPLYGGSNSLASAVLPSWDNIESFPDPCISLLPSYPTEDQTKPRPTYIDPKASGTYTGLIVDCRGLGLQPVMSPTIKNSNNEPIYGYKNLDYAKVIEKGMASYSKDGYSNLERAGKNPLVVGAIRLDGHNSNPVLSREDARLVLAENQATGFLNSCSVVFIR